jgi:hypothetical protein
MKFISTRLLAALTGIAGIVSTAAGNPAYTSGDLLLGFRATNAPGSARDYVVNIGNAAQFTQATSSFVVSDIGNIGTDLSGLFSDAGVAEWHSRGDVFWGVVGTDLAADPANTLYASRPRSGAGNPSTPWSRRSFSSQSATNSTFRAFISGFVNSASNASSPKATIQDVSFANSYASFTSGSTDFGYFAGLEGNFASGAAASALDLYRLSPTTQNPAGEGQVYVGTFQVSSGGQLTFTPAPSTAPSFQLSAAAYSALESAGAVSVRVVRTGLTTGTNTVQLDTANGTALDGTDYTALTAQIVTFAAGETQKDVNIPVASRAGIQGNRSFSVALSSPSAGALGSPASATVTLSDAVPSNPGALGFSAADYSFSPLNNQATPNTLAITLTRSSGTDGAVSVDLAVAAGGTLINGTDYTTIPSPTTLQFAAGESSKTFQIQLANVADSKLPGTIKLALLNPTNGASLGENTATTITVNRKDKAKPTLALGSKSGTVNSGTFQIVGSARDNAGIDRVEVRVNGGAVQLATLGSLINGRQSFDLSNIALENGKNTLSIRAADLSGNTTTTTTLTVYYANNRPALAGEYTGLLSATGTPSNNTTGLVTLSVSRLGLFTGKATLGTSVTSFKGIIDNSGAARFNASGNTADAPASLALRSGSGRQIISLGSLALNVTAGSVTGTLKDANSAVLAELQAARRFFDGKTPQTSVPGEYLSTRGNFTVVFPARATQTGLSSAEFPQGDGIGTVRITANGVLTLKGTLADGTPIVTTAPIAQDLRSPLFAKLYKSQGAIAGVLTLDSTRADSDLTGDNLRWIRPAAASLKHYPNGWPSSILLDLVGAKYASVPGTRVLAGLGADDLVNGNAVLGLTDGKLASPVSKTVNVTAGNKVTNAPADATFSLKLTPGTGLFSGKFKHSDNTSPAFQGVILQKGANAAGFGFFLSTAAGPAGESGAVSLGAK